MAVGTLEELMRDEFEAFTALNDYLTAAGRNPLTAVFPRADDAPDGGTPTPFIVIQYGGIAGDIILHTALTVYVYDNPDERYWRIEDIVTLLRGRFDHRRMGETLPFRPHWIETQHQLTSPRLTDDEWNKNMMFIRFETWGGQATGGQG